MTDPQVWFVTGASSGFGRAIAVAAAEAGDTVVAAVRKTAALDELVATYPGLIDPVALDVTDGPHPAAPPGTTDAGRAARRPARRAVRPDPGGAAADAGGSGAIVMMSSVGGQVVMPGFGVYCGTKFALEGVAEALAAEVQPFGIKVLVVEPGAFRTNLFGPGAAVLSEENPVYADTAGATRRFVEGGDGTQPGDPAKAAAAIRATCPDTPLRLPLDGDAVDLIVGHLDSIRTELTPWEKVSRGTDFDEE